MKLYNFNKKKNIQKFYNYKKNENYFASAILYGTRSLSRVLLKEYQTYRK